MIEIQRFCSRLPIKRALLSPTSESSRSSTTISGGLSVIYWYRGTWHTRVGDVDMSGWCSSQCAWTIQIWLAGLERVRSDSPETACTWIERLASQEEEGKACAGGVKEKGCEEGGVPVESAMQPHTMAAARALSGRHRLATPGRRVALLLASVSMLAVGSPVSLDSCGVPFLPLPVAFSSPFKAKCGRVRDESGRGRMRVVCRWARGRGRRTWGAKATMKPVKTGSE